jgi:hypothetical protein
MSEAAVSLLVEPLERAGWLRRRQGRAPHRRAVEFESRRAGGENVGHRLSAASENLDLIALGCCAGDVAVGAG